MEEMRQKQIETESEEEEEESFKRKRDGRGSEGLRRNVRGVERKKRDE